jgi:predicted amidohydrolase YtcJ
VKTLYRAARVHTLGHPRTGEWLVVDERHVQRVGMGDPPEADRVVELPGATIVPGLIDSHVHLTSTGLSLRGDGSAEVRSKEELLDLARARARAGADDDIVVLSGFDETRWDLPEHPVLAELDAAVRGPLVIGRADGHLVLVNAETVRRAEVDEVAGLERDDAGVPTGRVTGAANRAVRRWLAASRTEHAIEELQLEAAGLAAARGITSLHEMSMPREDGERDLEVLLRHRARLPVDVVPIPATMDVPSAIEQGLASIGGDLPVDGSIGARTAALTSPYADRPDDGVAYYEDDELTGFFHDAHDAGLQVGVHAIGDRAIEQVLASWERIYGALDSRERRHFRARRHRVEHFEMPSMAHVERAAMLGLAVSVQPAFDRTWGFPGGLYEIGVGAARAAAMNPFRTMLDRGLVVGAGSDAPVTALDPWLSVAAMQGHHDARERVSRIEAIRIHTVGSARLAHQEEKKGALESGMHADFCAYDVDPLDVEDVEGLRPVLTVSLGREVFVA